MGVELKEKVDRVNSVNGLQLENQSERNLRLLLDTIEGINRTMEFKTLLAQSMEATRIVMNSEASSLMLLDEDTGELFVSLPTGPVKEEIKGMSIPKSQGVGGWVIENKRPFISNDVESTEFFWGDLVEDFKTRNIICVPLINTNNETIGVLQALNRRRSKDFTPHDIPVFQALAAHVTAAVERARQIESLHTQLKEKEVLLTEIHHRIKNNLAAITGIIELELPEIQEENAKQILKETYSRIQSMIQVHDLLCQKGLFRDVELGMYLRQLTEKVKDTMGDMAGSVDIHLKADNIHISANKALLCGMILNELLVNMYKHAFVDREKGNISVELLQRDNRIILDVRDDGVGLPKKFKEKNKSIGMWIVDVLLKKLEGTIDTIQDNGTHFRIAFPK